MALVFSITCSLIGLLLNLYSSYIVLKLYEEEKQLRTMSTNGSTFDKRLEELFEQKIMASRCSYAGVILIATGFITHTITQIKFR